MMLGRAEVLAAPEKPVQFLEDMPENVQAAAAMVRGCRCCLATCCDPLASKPLTLSVARPRRTRSLLAEELQPGPREPWEHVLHE